MKNIMKFFLSFQDNLIKINSFVNINSDLRLNSFLFLEYVHISYFSFMSDPMVFSDLQMESTSD